MKYKIVGATTTVELITVVEEQIRAGWQPLGGIAFDRINHPYQAMIQAKKAKAEKE